MDLDEEVHDGLYIALLYFHLCEVPLLRLPSFVLFILLRCLCVRERVFVNLFCTNTHLSIQSALPPSDSIAHYDEIHLMSLCLRNSCVPSENNNRVGLQTGSVYRRDLNRLIISLDNDRTG